MGGVCLFVLRRKDLLLLAARVFSAGTDY